MGLKERLLASVPLLTLCDRTRPVIFSIVSDRIPSNLEIGHPHGKIGDTVVKSNTIKQGSVARLRIERLYFEPYL